MWRCHTQYRDSSCTYPYIYPFMMSYLFIFILKFQLTAKIYPSTFLLRFMSTVVSVHQYTSSVYFFFFGITCIVTFQLIDCGTYTEIFPEINFAVSLHASLSSNHKDLPITTTTSIPAHRCTRSLLYLLIFIYIFIPINH